MFRIARLRCRHLDYGHTRVGELVEQIRKTLRLEDQEQPVSYSSVHAAIEIKAGSSSELDRLVERIVPLLPEESGQWDETRHIGP